MTLTTDKESIDEVLVVKPIVMPQQESSSFSKIQAVAVPTGSANVLENCVPPKVLYNERSLTDKWWGVAYVLSYIAFLSTGFFLVSNAHVRYETDEFGQTQISSHFKEDVMQCCSGQINKGGLCAYIDSGGGRRLTAGNSTFVGDEGIFDAFLAAPQIIVGLFALILGKSALLLLDQVLVIAAFSLSLERERELGEKPNNC